MSGFGASTVPPGVGEIIARLQDLVRSNYALNQTLSRLAPIVPPLVGVTNGSAAAAGMVGETASVLAGLPGVAITSGVNTDVVTLALQPGDWDVEGWVYFNPSNKADAIHGWLNNVATTQPDGSLGALVIEGGSTTAEVNGLSTGTRQFNVAVPTTVYLGGRVTLTSGTCTVAGLIRARRVR